MLRSLYSMRFVSQEDYAICKQKFEEKHGRLMRKQETRAIVECIEWYHDTDEKWSYETYAYHKSAKLPMPLFSEYSYYDSEECGEIHQYMINDYVISEEGYNVGYYTKDGVRIK